MLGNFVTLLARYRLLFVFWGITLALILAALGIQGWETGLKSQGDAFTYMASNCPVPVTLTYPSFLFLPSSSTPEQSIVIFIADPAKSYNLVMRQQEWFTFYGSDQTVKSHISYWADTANKSFTAALRIPSSNGNQELELHFQGDDVREPFSCTIGLQDEIDVETACSARLRTGLGIFAHNIALPLGLLSAIAGWVVSYLAKETDKLEIAFREKMGKLATQFPSDPLYVVEQCLELKRIVGKKSLGRDAVKELNYAVHSLFNKAGVGKLLKQIGERSNRQDQIGLMFALALVVSFYRKFAGVLNKKAEAVVVFRALRYIYDYFGRQKNLALLSDLKQPLKTSIGKWSLPPFVLKAAKGVQDWLTKRRIRKAENVIEHLLRIWDEQDVYSADFVLYGLNRFQDIPLVLEHVRNHVEVSPRRRRLKRYKQMAWLGGEPEPYNWPSLCFREEPLRYPLLYEWFKTPQSLISSNPFEPQPRCDPWLLHPQCIAQKNLPQPWERLISAEPALFTAKSAGDLLSTAFLVQDACQNPGKYGRSTASLTFPIFFEIPDGWDGENWLLALAHRTAEVWLDFLACSPDAFLDIYPDERHALASWLGWHCGSNEIAVERQRQRLFRALVELQEKGDGKKIEEKNQSGQLLLDFLREEKCTYTKENQPSQEQVLHWLSIRPFGVEHTIVLLVAQSILSPSLSLALAKTSPVLLAHNIVLKQFRLEDDAPPEHKMAIEWPQDILKEILATRIRLTSSGRETFADLFEKPPRLRDFALPDYDDELAQKAQGSLNRLLELGLKVLQHHAKHRPDALYLLNDDFGVIESL